VNGDLDDSNVDTDDYLLATQTTNHLSQTTKMILMTQTVTRMIWMAQMTSRRGHGLLLDDPKGTWCDGLMRGRGGMVCCWMIRVATKSTLMTEIVCAPPSQHRQREALKQRHRQRGTLQQRCSPASTPLSSASTRERSLKATRPLQQWAPATSGLGFCASGWLTPCVGPISSSANKLVKSMMMGFGGDSESDDSDDSADKRQDTIKW
jgi:hypothetical protein